MKIGTRGVLRSLSMNLHWKCRNSKWRIQYGRPEWKNLLDYDKNEYSEVIGIADSESSLQISKFKMAYPIWWIEM